MFLTKHENSYYVRNNEKIPIIHMKPENGIYLSVIYQLTKNLEVSIEQIKILQQLISENIDESYEIVCFYPHAKAVYTKQVPEIIKRFDIFPYQCQDNTELGRFVEGAIRARGKYVLNAYMIAYEIDRIPKDGSYLSVVSPKLDTAPMFYNPLNILVPVCGSKEELMRLFLNLHNLNVRYGVGAELSHICRQQKLQMNVSQLRFGPSTVSFWSSYVNNLYSAVVPFLYRINH
ncbi:hypothetical protein GPJ56_000675 [Histomonas meleagridis]|uniref:uncharacterized protein n=1 Tax=Histomonas meleagridis TaxID=135588 RepID=UPI00355A3113|nr:hypothetical protein GPJ56_000675 [Histomonas meleagridis]KAH0804804.1 hypothetical protein GO595_002498 [Histomonas meleagridis]